VSKRKVFTKVAIVDLYKGQLGVVLIFV